MGSRNSNTIVPGLPQKPVRGPVDSPEFVAIGMQGSRKGAVEARRLPG